MSSSARPARRLLLPLLVVLAAAVAAGAGVYLVPRLAQQLFGDDAPPLRYVDPASIPGTVMDEAAARSFFAPLIGGPSRFEYDPVAWVVLKPDTGNKPVPWPEHPTGQIVQNTNNMGFREDQPTAVEKHGYRILVTGDSHTDGAVNNSESYANVLEYLLNIWLDPSGASQPVEVINGGVGGTGPHNYLALLQRHLDLQPDLVIAGLYVGNDFMNALMHGDFMTKRQARKRDKAYMDRYNATRKEYPNLPEQGYNQPYLFEYTGDAELALERTVEVFQGLAGFCVDHGIRFTALVIPCKADVDGDDDGERIRGMLEMLELSDEDWAVNRWLSDHFVERLTAAGVDCLDPTQAMIDEPAPLYWRKDHHLSTAGHAFVGRLLFQRLRDTVAAGVAARAAAAGAGAAPPVGSPAAGQAEPVRR